MRIIHLVADDLESTNRQESCNWLFSQTNSGRAYIHPCKDMVLDEAMPLPGSLVRGATSRIRGVWAVDITAARL